MLRCEFQLCGLDSTGHFLRDSMQEESADLRVKTEGTGRWTDFGLTEGHQCCPWLQRREIMGRAADGGRKEYINEYLFSYAE